MADTLIPTHRLSRKAAHGEAKAFFERALAYKGDDCLIWPFSFSKDGYAAFTIKGETGRIASKRICTIVHGPAPTTGHEAAHSCGNGRLGCITPGHLSWKTPMENSLDRAISGGAAKKLTEEDVREIRRLGKTLTGAEIAKLFGVGQPMISRVVSRKFWRWLD